MVDSVLVPIDGSEHSYQALEYVIEQFPDAKLTCLYVVDVNKFSGDTPWYSDPDDVQEKQEAKANAIFEEATDRIGKPSKEINTVTEYGDIPREIVKYIEQNEIDLTVMGSKGQTGISRILLGSIAESVVRHSPTSVLVAR